jgi:hypothetical protein
MRFFSYKDSEWNTREQIEKVRSHLWIAKEVPVRGFVFDVETGLLSEVQAVPRQTAAAKMRRTPVAVLRRLNTPLQLGKLTVTAREVYDRGVEGTEQ